MPVTSLAQILIRIYAFNFVLVSLFLTSAYVGTTGLGILITASIAIIFIAGFLLWKFAPQISRILASGLDEKVDLKGINAFHLYTTAILVVGLYFALNSFASFLNWIHYAAMAQLTNSDLRFEGAPPLGNDASLYNFSQSGLTFAAGLFLIFTAKKWGRKMAFAEGKTLEPEQD